MLMQDVRHAFRMLKQTPVITVAAILTLALGIGANTAVFSVVYAVILRPLPYPDPDRLLELFESNRTGPTWRVSALNYLSWTERTRSFEAIGAFNTDSFNLSNHGDPERFPGCAITSSMFHVLGVAPIVGRPLRTDDERLGSDRVALLSEPLWRRRFGADPSIVGQSITLNDERYQVIGVVPQAFRDVGRTQISSVGDPQVFVPLRIDAARENRGNHALRVVGRLRPGVSVEQAREEMRAIAVGMQQEFPATNRDWSVHLERVHDSMLDPRIRTSLFLVLGAVGAVLLIACANVANLLLARGILRRRELALRAALGATPGRLVRQLLTESVCLSTVSGGCGLLVSGLAVQALRSQLPATLPRIADIRVDAVIVGFGLFVAVVSGLFFGVLPARRATRVELLPELGQSGKGVSAGSGAALRHALVVAQMGLATTLVVAAVLFVHSLIRLQMVPLGFEPAGVITARVSLPETKYSDARQISTFYGELLQSFEGRPEIQAVGVSTSAPFAPGVRATAHVRIPAGSNASPDVLSTAVEHMVSAGYFRALGVQLLAGRFFEEDDGPGSTASSRTPLGSARGKSACAWRWAPPAGRFCDLSCALG